mgnify:CR=1 FL=1
MKRSIRVAIIIIAGLGVLAAPTGYARGLDAEGVHGKQGPRDLQKIKARMKKIRLKLLQEKVGLTPEKVETVTALLDANSEARLTLQHEMKTAHRRLTALVEADPDDADAFEVTIDALLRARRALANMRHDELSQLRKLLEPREVGRLMIALDHLKRKMHRKRNRRPGKGKRGRVRGDRQGDEDLQGRRSGGQGRRGQR